MSDTCSVVIVPGTIPATCARPVNHDGHHAVQWNEEDERRHAAVSGAQEGPPALPDEVWRFEDGSGAVTLIHDAPCQWQWSRDAGLWLWATGTVAGVILGAWAMAERARADAATREADRLRHGVAIEGDYVCPDALRADRADADAARLLAERADVVRLLGAPPDADVCMAAKNAVAKVDAMRRERDDERAISRDWEERVNVAIRRIDSGADVAVVRTGLVRGDVPT